MIRQIGNILMKEESEKQKKDKTIHHFKVIQSFRKENSLTKAKTVFTKKKVEMIENNVFWRGVHW